MTTPHDTPTTKTCLTCSRTFPLTHFHKSTRTKDGLLTQCKLCVKIVKDRYRNTENGKQKDLAYSALYRASGKAKIASRRYEQTEKRKMQKKTYSQTSERKLTNKLYQQSEKGELTRKRYTQTEKGKLNSALNCKHWRMSDKGKSWHFQYNRSDTGKANMSRYKATAKGRESAIRGVNKRRSLASSTEGQLTAQEWNEIKEEFLHCCAYCGVQESSARKLTRDHLVPLTKGGLHVKKNIVPACQPCNSAKGNKIITL